MNSETDPRAAGQDLPIVCTLTDEDASRQALEWIDLQHRALSIAVIEGGVRMTLPASLLGDVDDLTRRESQCCEFLAFATAVTDDVLELDISSRNPDALPVILALAGVPDS